MLLLPVLRSPAQPPPMPARDPGGAGDVPRVLPPVPNEDSIVEEVFKRFPDVDPDPVMEEVRREFSRDLAEFKNLAMRHRDRAVDYLTYLVSEAVEMLEMKRQNPDLYKKASKHRRLERTARRLAAEWDRLDGEQKQQKHEELGTVLGDAFDAKQEMMKADVAQMQEGLKELLSMIEKRQKSRKEIIVRRIKELTGVVDPLEW
ncbi:MAG: hypothetical protein HQ559_09190 [Lentisphaerae bacterium]|nr:hypothetical protein [Lentisphaerota bacterium]